MIKIFRLKIITAPIDDDGNEDKSDISRVHYVSQCPIFNKDKNFSKSYSNPNSKILYWNKIKEDKIIDNQKCIDLKCEDLNNKYLFIDVNKSLNKSKSNDKTRRNKSLSCGKFSISRSNFVILRDKKPNLNLNNLHTIKNNNNSFYKSESKSVNSQKKKYLSFFESQNYETQYSEYNEYDNKIKQLLKLELKVLCKRDQIIIFHERRIAELRNELKKTLKYDEKIKQYQNNLGNLEINTKDEINGEIILLKNKKQSLLNSIKQINNRIKEYKQIIQIKNSSKKVNQEINNIDSHDEEYEIKKQYKNLNISLQKGKILLLNIPNNLNQIKIIQEDEIKKISLFLRAYLFNSHIFEIDNLITIIWDLKKPIQTVETLSEELMKLLSINNQYNKYILQNYFYSIFKNYEYVTLDDFIIIFAKSLGTIKTYNKYACMNKLNVLYKDKFRNCLSFIKNLDTSNSGIIDYEDFLICLNKCDINLNSNSFTQDLFEFLIYVMKNKKLLLMSNKKINTKNSKFFDIFYENLFEIMNNINSKKFTNYKEILKAFLKENEIQSVKILINPLLTNDYLIKKKNGIFIESDILNKFMKILGIINNKECFIFNSNGNEEDLVDINKFIQSLDADL